VWSKTEFFPGWWSFCEAKPGVLENKNLRGASLLASLLQILARGKTSFLKVVARIDRGEAPRQTSQVF
jgi:hypothetical protein